MHRHTASSAPLSKPLPRRQLKFVMFPLSFVLAHVGRLVEIAKVLRSRGHEVVFAGESLTHPRTRLHLADREGFRVVYAKEPNQPYAWDRFLKYGWPASAYDLMRFEKWAPLDEIIDSQVRLIEREQPDIVVGDASVSVSTAAYITGVAAAGVMNSYAGQFLSNSSPFNPIIRTWNKLQLEPVRRRVYKKYGCSPICAIELAKAMPLLSPDLPGFYTVPKGWSNWQTIGPIMSEPTAELPGWFDELSDGRTNIYVTMGSTGNLDPFLRNTFDVLGKSPYRFIVTTAGQADQATIDSAPSNFRIVKYAPGLRILEKCKLMVYHGGNGSMYQALSRGVPMIALPNHLEQVINANLAVRHGFGVRMSLRAAKGERLIRTIDRVLGDHSFRNAAARYANDVGTTNGARNAADILERTALATVAAENGSSAGLFENEALVRQEA
jgi:UDP:flavonoid glycosyltransferase YjiC (YdhE family)